MEHQQTPTQEHPRLIGDYFGVDLLNFNFKFAFTRKTTLNLQYFLWEKLFFSQTYPKITQKFTKHPIT